MTASRYVARIVQVSDHGIRFVPAEGTVPPEQPTEVNLLGMAIALALGAAGYRHHPEPRNSRAPDPGRSPRRRGVMPWLPATDAATDAYIVCELTPAGPTARSSSARTETNSQTTAVRWKPTPIGGFSRRPRCMTASSAANQ